MIPGYKIWRCCYRWSGGRGGFQDYDCVVIAETESKAIGMALMEYSDTKPDCWKAYEIESTFESVTPISESSS